MRFWQWWLAAGLTTAPPHFSSHPSQKGKTR